VGQERGGDNKEVKEDEVKVGRSGGIAAPATKTGLCTASSVENVIFGQEHRHVLPAKTTYKNGFF
jgi:hypothetical protein